MSAVFTIFIYSHQFIVPVSITYCKVVAMAAVGLVDKTLNWSLFCKILLFWFLTIPATAVISGFVYAVMF
jgi:phosphate/sulfate permease